MKTYKNILLIECGQSGYGGSFHSLYITIKNLNQNKYKFNVVFFNKSVFYERLTKIGTECHYINDVIFSDGGRWQKYILGKLNGFMLKYFPLLSVWFEYIIHSVTISKIKMLARSKNIDLIHLNNQVMLNFMGLFVAKSLSIPCVSHLRTFNSYGLNQYKTAYTRIIKLHYIAISEQIKRHWVQKGLDSKKVDVIYNVYQSIESSDLRDNGVTVVSEYDGYKIIFVGRLIKCKGIPFLVKGFEQIMNNNINAKLFLVGDGEEEKKLKEYVSELNVKQHVFFLGYRSSPQAFIRNANLLVLPSNEEGFGRVLLEAMDVGTPVVGTRIGGIPEIIEHGTNGLLVDYGDIEALKNSIIEILEDKLLRKKLIQGGYETINSKFCVETYQEKLEDIYDTLLDVAN
jgi:glycosyltransferase involved in cell wall biosynthesis